VLLSVGIEDKYPGTSVCCVVCSVSSETGNIKI
jgi:hypothetical protein